MVFGLFQEKLFRPFDEVGVRVRDIYKDGTYLDNNPSWHSGDSQWKAEKIIEILARNTLDTNSICEVGCGAGGVLYELSSQFSEKEFCGYEISPQAYELCARRDQRDNLSFLNKDLLIDDIDPFDLVLSIDVFEHVEDCFSFLRQLKDKGEYKLFHIPLDLSVQKLLRGYPLLRSRRRLGHIHYFTKDLALELLEDCGYSVVDYCYTNSLDIPGQDWKTKLVRYPIKLCYLLNKDIAVRLLGGYSLMVLAK